MVRSACSVFVSGFLVLSGLGCGAGSGSVSGKVTLKDQPVPSGRVTFTQGNKTASADIKPDGSYEAAGVPAGDVKVAVVNPMVTSTPSDKKAVALMKGMQKNVGGDTGPSVVEAPVKSVMVPVKYSDPEKSGLTVTVKNGETTTFNIDLK